LFQSRASIAYITSFSYDSASKKASVLIRTIDRFNKNRVKLSFTNADHLSSQDLLGKIAGKTIEYLLTLKNDQTQPQINIILIEIPIANLGNWLMIKNKIENSGLITKINVESLSSDYAKISVSYANQEDGLIAAFAKIGIFLTKKSEKSYIISITPTI
jgi:hypothetical protein